MENYYLAHENRIMREVHEILPHYRWFAVEAYGTDLADALVKETLENFWTLLPQTPYIGGSENSHTKNLVLTVPLLTFYQALKSRGMPVEDAARIIYKGTESMYSSFPLNWMLWFQGRMAFTRTGLDRVKRMTEITQRRQYPGDWLATYIPGDSRRFIFGVDYTECGIVKYLAAHGASELAPYLCWLDVPMCRNMHIGLVRTETLATGDARCNFRFCRERDCNEMVPGFL